MQSGSYWAYRSAGEIPDRDHDAPTVRILWDKKHVARRAHLCSLCDEEISPGTPYRSVGVIVDGEFETQKSHGAFGAGAYPSQCPRFAERDREDIAAQFEADRLLLNPTKGRAPNSPQGRT